MKNMPAKLPDKEPTLRVTTRPNDANPNGDIFGGWLMSQIDVAGAIAAVDAAKGPVATVAVKSLQFINPLYPHDVVSFYTNVLAIGNTSVTVGIEVFAHRRLDITHKIFKVSEAVFVYVAVEVPGVKRVRSK
jgi:acyl-CoA thioesterase YciA